MLNKSKRLMYYEGCAERERFRLIVSLGILMELRFVGGRVIRFDYFAICERERPLNFHYYTILLSARPSVSWPLVRAPDMSPLSFIVPPERTSAISLPCSFFFQLTPHFLHPSSNLSSLPFTTWAVSAVLRHGERRLSTWRARPRRGAPARSRPPAHSLDWTAQP